MFLPLLVGLPFLSLNSALICGTVNPKIRDFSNCTEASKVVVVDYGEKNLAMLNSLKKVAKPLGEVGLHYVYVLIENNPNLEYDEANFLPNLNRIRSYSDNHKQHAIKILIRNNSRLCIPKKARDRFRRITQGNMFIQKCNCYTNGTMANNSTVIYGGPQCYRLTGKVFFGEGFTATRRLWDKLKTVEVIEGNLIVNNTKLKNLGFFRKLRKIISTEGSSLRITYNKMLTCLQLYSLMKLETKQNKSVMWVYQNPNLRVPLYEKNQYLYIGKTVTIESRWGPVYIDPQLCYINESMYKNLKDFVDCEMMLGDLVIDSNWNNINRKEIITVFSEISRLHGCLTIKGTNLKILDFLPSLHRIRCYKNRSAIVIEDNSFLEEIRLQVNEIVHHKDFPQPEYTIQRNPRMCNETVKELRQIQNEALKYKLMTINFDGESRRCFDPEEESQKLEWILLLVAGGVFLVITGMAEMIVRLRRRRKQRLKV